MTKVKICGITDAETARFACEFGADALGFVFAKSKRQVSPIQAQAIILDLPSSIRKVGVFVNEKIENVKWIFSKCGLDYVQLHGDESNSYIKSLDLPVIKAVGIGSKADVEQISSYEADYLLVDSPKGTTYQGGNGVTFDWELLKDLDESIRKRLIVAGGLDEQNVQKAICEIRPYIVDASSSLETDGKKDMTKIARFIEKVKRCS
ncbi:phosphoribosylanthranilate isomerase [Risungbinella massiliensis]|uniref:phosphoribosylanthranilate isomerase n=1 Tax=Risungbinella massiliensis TaxID=1329796 RepID=UPI0005CC7EA7|nr:phosphoribosylanthranilate isomerase [Risungbinella massiliensis]